MMTASMPELVDSASDTSDDEGDAARPCNGNGHAGGESDGVEEVDPDAEPNWPPALIPLLKGRPTRKDFDKNGMFLPGTPWAKGRVLEDPKRVMSVTEIDPIHSRTLPPDSESDHVTSGAKAVPSSTTPAKSTTTTQTAKPSAAATQTKPAPKQPVPEQKQAKPAKPAPKPEPVKKTPSKETKKAPEKKSEPADLSGPHLKIQKDIDSNYSKAAAYVSIGGCDKAIEMYEECLKLSSYLPEQPSQIRIAEVVLFFLKVRIAGGADKAGPELILKLDGPLDTLLEEISKPLKYLVKFCNSTMAGSTMQEDIRRQSLFEAFSAMGHHAAKDFSPVNLPGSSSPLLESTPKYIREFILDEQLRSLQLRFGRSTFNLCVYPACPNQCAVIIEHELFKCNEVYSMLECDSKCRLYYHQSCFKDLPKWSLDEACLTPDCEGRVVRQWESGQLKRESKIEKKPKEKPEKPKERPRTTSEKSKKPKQKKNRTSSNPTPPPTTPPPSDTTEDCGDDSAPSTSPEPPVAAFTGDDVVEFYGTLALYVDDQNPGAHITDAVMNLNYLFPWVKISIFDVLWDEIGVESVEVRGEGKLHRRATGSDAEREAMLEKDMSLIIEHYKKLAEAPPPPKSVPEAPVPAKQQQQQPKKKKNSEDSPQSSDPPATDSAKDKTKTSKLGINVAAPEFQPSSSPAPFPPFEGYQPAPVRSPAAHPTIHDTLLQRATASLPVTTLAGSPLIGAPIPNATADAASYAERKALTERVIKLEAELEEVRSTKSKELDNYKTQLCEQMNSYAQLKAKTKQYKQEAKTAQDVVAEKARQQDEFDQLVKKFEDERKSWLNERTGKSHESKKVMLQLRLEIEETTKKYETVKKENEEISRKNADLSKTVSELEESTFARDRKIEQLRLQVQETTQRSRIIERQETQERFQAAQLQLRIAYANCAAQIRERTRMNRPEQYKLSQWIDCQEAVKHRIDDNAIRYGEYSSALHSNSYSDPKVVFEKVPECPPMETGVPMLPLQRYDDILLGKPAPELPEPGPSAATSAPVDSELLVLRSMISSAARMEQPSTAEGGAVPPPGFSGGFEIEGLLPPRIGGEELVHPPRAASIGSSGSGRSAERTGGRGRGRARQPASTIPPGVPALGRAKPAVLQPTRRPGQPGSSSAHSSDSGKGTAPPEQAEVVLRAAEQGSRPPMFSPPAAEQPARNPFSPPTPQSAPPRMVGRAGGVGAGTGTGAGAGAGAGGAGGPLKAANLTKKISETFSFLNTREIMSYLRRVREDMGAVKVTPDEAFQRLCVLVKADYPDPGSAETPTAPSVTCVICQEGLNIRQVLELSCGHAFHRECVDRWLAENHTCPTCRRHELPDDAFPPLG